MEKLAVSVVEASKLVGISRSKMYLALACGQLSGRKVGRRTIILMSDIERWVQNLPNLMTPQKSKLD